MRDITLDYYNSHAREFADSTKQADMHDEADRFLKEIVPGGHILDLGCGSGRDSKYFLEKGYHVTAVDGSLELCRIASEYIGQDVICRDFFEINEEETYDGIWACASLLHVEKERLPELLQNLHRALKEQGILYVSFKEGASSGMRNGRYFTDMTEDTIKELFADSDWREVQVWQSLDVRDNHPGESWVNGVFRKSLAGDM